jgi:hypothetical protein
MSQSRSYLHQISISNGGVPKLAVKEARITPEGVVGDRQQNVMSTGALTEQFVFFR